MYTFTYIVLPEDMQFDKHYLLKMVYALQYTFLFMQFWLFFLSKIDCTNVYFCLSLHFNYIDQYVCFYANTILVLLE